MTDGDWLYFCDLSKASLTFKASNIGFGGEDWLLYSFDISDDGKYMTCLHGWNHRDTISVWSIAGDGDDPFVSAVGRLDIISGGHSTILNF